MSIRKQTIAVTGATGGAGVATASANGQAPVDGEIVAVYVEYLDAPPVTTDVTIETVQSPAVPILTLANANSDGWFYPVATVVNQSAVAVTDGYVPIAVTDAIKVTIAQANDGDGVNVTLIWKEK